MTVTSTELLEKIKRAVTVPASQIRFSDANILEFADEETQATILPMLLSLRENFLLKQEDVAVVANQSKYKIPYRAIGRTLRDLKLATTDNNYVTRLTNIELADRYRFAPNVFGQPLGFTPFSDYIELVPIPQQSDAYVIQMFYELAPSALVGTSSAGVVQSFSTVTGVVVIDTAVSDFSTGDVMDIIDGETGNTNKALDITNTAVSGTSVTFDVDDLPDTLAVGDYIALSGETPVVQLPEELHQSLVQAVVCRLLEAQGDFEGLQAAEGKLAKKMEAASVLLSPRVESERPVIINRNGLLQQRPYNYRFRYIV